VDDVIAGIGVKIRLLRQGQGLSLQQLADRSGVSAASIHKIERNSMVPTITILMKLATALDRSVSYLIDEDGDQASSAVLVRAKDRDTLFASRKGVHMENIAGPLGRFALTAALVTIAPAADSGRTALAYPGEELIFVLNGSLEFEIERTFVVRQGDSLHLQADRPHRWRNPGPRPAKALWVSLGTRGSS
jgi:transcriptional regulator with XRE-family HTH domain